MLDAVRELTSFQPAEPAVLFRQPPPPARGQAARSSAEVSAVESRIDTAARSVGARLLASETADELDDRLDELLESGDVRRAHAAVGAAVAELRTRFGALAGTQVSVAALRLRFGDRAADLVIEAMAANDQTASALQRRERAILRGSVSEVVPGIPDQLQDAGGIAWVWQLPAKVGEALLAKERGTACSMALYVAMLETETSSSVPQRGVIEALAQRWQDGERAGLRFVASLPGSDVPADVVPADERLDLDGELERHRRADGLVREMSRAREAAGSLVHPPFDDSR